MSATIEAAEPIDVDAAAKTVDTGDVGAISGEEMYRLGLEASVGGEGADFSLVVAHKWFNLAAMHGSVEARAYRAELAKEMSSEEIAEAQRLAREYLATHRPRYHG
ncbi:MAG: sel1 repeat family protein [Pseudomonadota bacterium]